MPSSPIVRLLSSAWGLLSNAQQVPDGDIEARVYFAQVLLASLPIKDMYPDVIQLAIEVAKTIVDMDHVRYYQPDRYSANPSQGQSRCR